jgi:hypothetical protein
MRLACWPSMHRPSSKLHFKRGIRAAAASLASFVVYQIEEDGTSSDRGHDKNNAQIHATLDEL